MFKRLLFSRRRRSRGSTSNGRDERQRRFVYLGILIGIALAVAFGLVLYSMNMTRRI